MKRISKLTNLYILLLASSYSCGGGTNTEVSNALAETRTLPNVGFGTQSTEATEGDTVKAEIVVQGEHDRTIQLSYRTKPGSALEEIDFSSVSGTLEILATEHRKVIEITLIDDEYYEVNETFVVEIYSSSNSRVIDNTLTITILDDDPRIHFNTLTLIEEEQIILDGQAEYGIVGFSVSDLDNDSKLDIALTSYGDGTVETYSQASDEKSSWQNTVVDENLYQAITVISSDIDKDGDVDLISGAFGEGSVNLHINDINQAGEKQWERQTIDSNAEGAIIVRTGDIDNDGNIDIVAAAYWDDSIIWYKQQPGIYPPSWERNIVDLNATRTHDIFLADINEDEQLDIVSANYGSNSITLYLNNGEGNIWRVIEVDNDIKTPTSLLAFKTGADANLSIVATSYTGDSILIYESDDSNYEYWQKSIIIDNIDAPFDLSSEDLDKDGFQDIISASYLADKDPEDGVMNNYIWLRQDATKQEWTDILIHSAEQGAHEIQSIDLDGDGWVDIMAAVPYHNSIKLFKSAENLRGD